METDLVVIALAWKTEKRTNSWLPPYLKKKREAAVRKVELCFHK